MNELDVALVSVISVGSVAGVVAVLRMVLPLIRNGRSKTSSPPAPSGESVSDAELRSVLVQTMRAITRVEEQLGETAAQVRQLTVVIDRLTVQMATIVTRIESLRADHDDIRAALARREDTGRFGPLKGT